MAEQKQHGPDEFEKHIANAIAKALGEQKVRYTDRRMVVLWVVSMLLFAGLITYGARAENGRKEFERQIIANCVAFNRFISTIQTTTASSPSLNDAQKAQRIRFYEKAKQKCPPSP